jgi:hypothetical protein
MSALGGQSGHPRAQCPLGATLSPLSVEASMKLYVTYTSPYARLARIVVMEKALEDRVEILKAKTRAAGSPQPLWSRALSRL